jgi:hypothetical protein
VDGTLCADLQSVRNTSFRRRKEHATESLQYVAWI